MERYSRQTMLPEIGEAGQLKLKAAKVLIVGVGGLRFSHRPLSGRRGSGYHRVGR